MAPSDCALRWVLRRGPASITCELDANADHSFDLRVEPSLSPSSGFVEHFDRATSAVERHAEVAALLLEAGWVVAERGTPTLAAA